jgi:hypothetical protein
MHGDLQLLLRDQDRITAFEFGSRLVHDTVRIMHGVSPSFWSRTADQLSASSRVLM